MNNKGNSYDPKNNYYISLSNHIRKNIFVKNIIGSNKTADICTTKSPYIDCSKSCFDIDTLNGVWKTNFKLLKIAEPGTWFIKAVVFNRQEIPSTSRVKKFVVKEQISYMPYIKVLLLFALFALILFVVLLIALKTRKREPDKVVNDGTVTDFRIKAAVQFINENYAKDITLDSVAKEIGLHSNRLSTKFNLDMGTSFKSYLNEVRCKGAVERLKDLKLTISEVGYLSGFKTPAYFNHVFRKRYGITPNQHRKELN